MSQNSTNGSKNCGKIIDIFQKKKKMEEKKNAKEKMSFALFLISKKTPKYLTSSPIVILCLKNQE